MELGEAIAVALSFIFGFGMIGVSILFICLQIKFIYTIPNHLKRMSESLDSISEALDGLSEKMGER